MKVTAPGQARSPSFATKAAGSASSMSTAACYLRPEVKVEPLVDRWSAWPHLLAPVQQALNLSARYLPIARSFVAAPDVHATAARNPATFGGPFLDLPPSAAPAVRAYISEVEARRRPALEFVDRLRELDRRLEDADGFSLDSIRESLPESLRGRVELVYDLANQAKARVLEEMFDLDDLGHSEAQELYLHTQADVDRPFFLSTPRLEDGAGHLVRTPFRAPAAQALCAAHLEPVDLHGLAEQLATSPCRLAPFFGPDAIRTAARYSGPGVRVRYLGHAALLIETAEISILVDPTVARDPGADHFSLADLPARIDILLISHGHQDHFSPETLLQLRSRVGTVLTPPHNHGDLADPSLKRMLRALGYERIEVLEPLKPHPIAGGAITPLPFTGEHCDLDVHSKQCAMIELLGRRIGLFIDTDAIDIDVYRRLAHLVAAPDLMFVGMECFGAPLSWLYGPLGFRPNPQRNDRSRRMSGANCARAWQLTETLQPRQVFVYAMGQEPWMRPLMGLNYTPDSIQLKECGEFVARCAAVGLPAEQLYLRKEVVL